MRMSGSILNVTFDCLGAASIARFWSVVTGWPWSKQEMPGIRFGSSANLAGRAPDWSS
jgi:hypothetical protein